jgi:hypothetical protein
LFTSANVFDPGNTSEFDSVEPGAETSAPELVPELAAVFASAVFCPKSPAILVKNAVLKLISKFKISLF